MFFTEAAFQMLLLLKTCPATTMTLGFCTSLALSLSDAKERGGKLLRTVRLMGLLGLRIQNILDAKGESSL